MIFADVVLKQQKSRISDVISLLFVCFSPISDLSKEVSLFFMVSME